MKSHIKVILFVILSLYKFNNEVFAQKNNYLLYFNDSMSTDSVNNLLKTNKFPFHIIIDSITPTKGQTELVVKYKDSISICRTYSDMSEVLSINKGGQFLYIIVFYDQVGYDFFFIIQEYPFRIYKSRIYNIEQSEGYNFINESINLKKKRVKISYIESKKEENIKIIKVGSEFYE